MLHTVAESGDVGIANLLLAHGAGNDINVESKNGCTPFTLTIAKARLSFSSRVENPSSANTYFFSQPDFNKPDESQDESISESSRFTSK